MAAAEKVAATFKIGKDIKRRVDLMASALGVEKSEVIEEAVRVLSERRRSQMERYLDDARRSFARESTRPREVLVGHGRSRGYVGGPAPR